MFDDEGELFNPFSVGTPSINQRFEYKMPKSPTYPPPVFATWPADKEHTNKSVSEGTLAKQDSGYVKPARSQMGEVAISKAINEEMAAAKEQATYEDRIYAGRESKAHMSEARSKDNKLHTSVTTLMPVRQRRSSSKTSIISVSSNASKASSAADKMSSKAASIHSHISNRTESTGTLKHQKGTLNLTKSVFKADNSSCRSQRAGAGANQADGNSRASLRTQADNVSRVSHKSRASAHQADKVSIKSKTTDHQADNVSRVSIKSKARDPEADNISRISIKSKASNHPADNISRISIKSKASNHPADNISRISIKSKADKIYRVSINSQEGDNVSRTVDKSVEKPSLKEVAVMVKKELEMSMETSKSLAEKAALISDRLKAGNEFKHNRFSSLIRMYTTTEPLKRCREDRMAFWFKDAVLS